MMTLRNCCVLPDAHFDQDGSGFLYFNQCIAQAEMGLCLRSSRVPKIEFFGRTIPLFSQCTSSRGAF